MIVSAAVYSCAVSLEKDGGAGFEREPEREFCVHIVPCVYNSRISLACAKSCALASQLSTNTRARITYIVHVYVALSMQEDIVRSNFTSWRS